MSSCYSHPGISMECLAEEHECDLKHVSSLLGRYTDILAVETQQ